MYKLCKTEQSAKRQKEIEKVLLELMMKKSYNDITITELCEKLDMPRKTFYRYYPDRHALLSAVYNDCYFSFIEVSAEDSFWDVFRNYFFAAYA